MPKIFISYRHTDSAAYAGRLNDRLSAYYGGSAVFMDLDEIEMGEDFAAAIRKAIEACRVVIVLIGPNWLAATDAQGRRRLDDPQDFVRLEIAVALERGIRVLPVLVNGASMPAPDALPESIRALARRHAHELSDLRWDYDIDQLITGIGGSGFVAAIRRNKWLKAALAIAVPVTLVIPLVFFLTGAAVDEAERFLALLAQEDFARAYAATATPFRARMNETAFTAAVRQLGLTDNASASWSSRSVENNNKATLIGVVVTKQRSRIPVTLMLVKEEGEWKVLSLSGPKVGIEVAGEPAAAIAGNWQAEVAYPWGATYNELFELKLASGAIVGSASFLGVRRGILEGKLERDHVSFVTRTEQMEGAATREMKHVYRGKIADDGIHFVMQTEGAFAPQPQVEFLAKKTP